MVADTLPVNWIMTRGKKTKKKCTKRKRQEPLISRVTQSNEIRGICKTVHSAHGISSPFRSRAIKSPSSKFIVSFASEELQPLRRILKKSDLSGTSTFVRAIILGKTDVAKRLLEEGYPVNSCNGGRTTPLMWAVRNKDLAMINLLVKYGADVALLDENHDNVALIAVQSISWSQEDFLQFWRRISRKINIEHANHTGNTIRHYAIKRKWKDLMELIGEKDEDKGREETEMANESSQNLKRDSNNRSPSVMETEEHEVKNHVDIVLTYRKNWQRDRELGYPGYEGARGDPEATHEECREIKRKEIARLNTILPKLEDSYIKKLKDSWTSLLNKIREIAYRDAHKFREVILLIRIQLSTLSNAPAEITNETISDNHNHEKERIRNLSALPSGNDVCHRDVKDKLNKSDTGKNVEIYGYSFERISRCCEQRIDLNHRNNTQQSLLLNGLLPKTRNTQDSSLQQPANLKSFNAAKEVLCHAMTFLNEGISYPEQISRDHNEQSDNF